MLATIVVIFHLAKYRQHVRIGPLGVAPRSPVVIILRNARYSTCPLTALDPPVALPRGMSAGLLRVSCAT